jgi:hypothetical protein
MKPPLRKLGVTSHVVFSVGWLDEDAGFLVLAIVGLTSQDVQNARAAYLAMDDRLVCPFQLRASDVPCMAKPAGHPMSNATGAFG